jgi:hypothetical protein
MGMAFGLAHVVSKNAGQSRTAKKAMLLREDFAASDARPDKRRSCTELLPPSLGCCISAAPLSKASD